MSAFDVVKYQANYGADWIAKNGRLINSQALSEDAKHDFRNMLVPFLAVSQGVERMRIKPDAVNLVLDSIVEDAPESMPSLFKGGPVFLEGENLRKSHDRPLTGILFYRIGNPDILCFSVVSKIDGEQHISSWRTGLICGENMSKSINRWIDLRSDYDSPHADAVKFLYTFALLWDAEKSPIERGKRSPINPDNQRPYKDKTTVRYVSLTKEYIESQRSQKPIIEPTPMDTKGMTQRVINVRGHIRNQACGPGMVERKQIFIAPHQSVRWLKDESVTVVTA